jgi:hypothetical protein
MEMTLKLFAVKNALVGIGVLVAFSVSSNATAADERCVAPQGAITMHGKCTCGRNLSTKFHVGRGENSLLLAPPKMPLVAVCGYVEDEIGAMGAYYFRGSIVVDGEFIRTHSDSRGDEVEFIPSEESLRQLPAPSYITSSIRVPESPKSPLLPRLTPKRECVSAKVKLQITALDHLEDEGTDHGGARLVGFKILRRAKAQTCQLQ